MWKPIRNGDLPYGAIAIACENGHPIFCVKHHLRGADVIGKYSSQYRTCYFPYGGNEIEISPNKCEVIVNQNENSEVLYWQSHQD